MNERLRCFRDGAYMQPEPGEPGWIRCPVCNFLTQLVGYDADDIAEMFHEEVLQKRRMSKAGSRSSGGRRRRKPYRPRPSAWTPERDAAHVARHNARMAKLARERKTG